MISAATYGCRHTKNQLVNQNRTFDAAGKLKTTGEQTDGTGVVRLAKTVGGGEER